MARNVQTVANRREQLRKQQQAAAAKARKKRIMLVAALVLLAVAVIIGAVIGFSYLSKETVKNAPPNATPDKSGIAIFPDKAKQGAKTVAVYSDFQCPFCAKFEKGYGAGLVKLAEAGDIRLEMHMLTGLDTHIRGEHSLRSTMAAACSARVNKYDAYFQTVFANQPKEGVGYTDQQLRVDYAEKAGITGNDLKTFQACYDNQEMKGFVKNAHELSGQTLTQASPPDQGGTPAMLVNGKFVSFAKLHANQQAFSAPMDVLKSLIDEVK